MLEQDRVEQLIRELAGVLLAILVGGAVLWLLLKG
jgi:hypothetical protein